MTIEHLLEEHGIRLTAMRLLVGRALQQADSPLSGQEIETILDTAERSTITRTLGLFLEHGLVHAIEDGSGSQKYELCLSHDHHEDSDLHPHFHCRACGRTLCLRDRPLPELALPDGFTQESASYIITGLCPACS